MSRLDSSGLELQQRRLRAWGKKSGQRIPDRAGEPEIVASIGGLDGRRGRTSGQRDRWAAAGEIPTEKVKDNSDDPLDSDLQQ